MARLPADNITVLPPPLTIDPSTPLSEQVNVIDTLCQMPNRANPLGFQYQVTHFSAALCQWLIDNRNAGNRPRRSGDVSKYVGKMKAKAWAGTGDTVKFDRHGILRDGQHRMEAGALSGTGITTLAAFGIDDAAVSVFDTGRKRSGGDALHIHIFSVSQTTDREAGVLAAATRWVAILEGNMDRGFSPTNDELLAAYDKLNTTTLRDCVKAARNYNSEAHNDGKLPMGLAAAVLYRGLSIHAPTARALRADLVNPKRPRAVGALHDRLCRVRQANAGRVHEDLIRSLAIQTWNAYRQNAGKVVRRSRGLTWSPGQKVPSMA